MSSIIQIKKTKDQIIRNSAYHIWSPTRAIYSEESQSGAVQTVQMVESVREQLAEMKKSCEMIIVRMKIMR
jgi:hypothetical protein